MLVSPSHKGSLARPGRRSALLTGKPFWSKVGPVFSSLPAVSLCMPLVQDSMVGVGRGGALAISWHTLLWTSTLAFVRTVHDSRVWTIGGVLSTMLNGTAETSGEREYR